METGGDDDAVVVLGRNLPVLPNNHGPQTDRLVYGLGPFKGYDSGDPTSREVGLYDQPFVDTFIHPLSNGGRIIAGQFDDPYQLDEKGIFDLVNLNRERSRRHPGRAPPAGRRRVHGLQPLLDRARGPDQRHLPARHPAQRRSSGRTRPTVCSGCGRASPAGRRRPSIASNIITGLKGSGDCVQVGRNALPLFNAGLVGTQRQTLYLRSSPLNDVTNFGADILFPVLVRDAEALGIYKALGVPADDGDHAQGSAHWTSSRPSTWAGRSRSPTASRVTSSRSTRRSIRASPTAAAWAAGLRRTAIR